MSDASSGLFQLDPRLEADTFILGHMGDCAVLLMNDSRWPWVILVPAMPDLSELHGLSPDLRASVVQTTFEVSEALRDFAEQRCSAPIKMNVANLGNMVRQLHIHVIARHDGDPGWPGPVWGFEQAVPYDGDASSRLVADLRDALRLA